MFDGADFGERRARPALTQAEVASRSGVPRPTISAIENGPVQPAPGTVEDWSVPCVVARPGPWPSTGVS